MRQKLDVEIDLLFSCFRDLRIIIIFQQLRLRLRVTRLCLRNKTHKIIISHTASYLERTEVARPLHSVLSERRTDHTLANMCTEFSQSRSTLEQKPSSVPLVRDVIELDLKYRMLKAEHLPLSGVHEQKLLQFCLYFWGPVYLANPYGLGGSSGIEFRWGQMPGPGFQSASFKMDAGVVSSG